jgi:enoyl-CoA hydratase/carnithine racemase
MHALPKLKRNLSPTENQSLRLKMIVYDAESLSVILREVDDCAIFVMTMNNGQNQFYLRSIAKFNEALDKIEQKLGEFRVSGKYNKAALVTTGTGKYFSTGLKLGSPETSSNLAEFLGKQYLPLMGRFLDFPLVTVAAINGHAYAGGMVLALAHDWRIMNSQRGYLCMNEIEIPSPIPEGMAAVIKAKIPSPSVIRDCLQVSKRFTADEALTLGFIDGTKQNGEDCFEEAIYLAVKLARSVGLGPIVKQIKREMYKDAIRCLENPGDMMYVPEIILKSKL